MRKDAFVVLIGAFALLACDQGVDVGGKGNGPGPGDGGGSGGPDPGTETVGEDCPTTLGFPGAASLTNLVGEVHGSTVRIRFDEPAKAADYRVYVLPKLGEVAGTVNQNAVYRCAGEYELPFIPQDVPPDEQGNTYLPQGSAYGSRVSVPVLGYARTEEEVTLGYVFTSPGPGRVPVYALGNSAPDAEQHGCGDDQWTEARDKIYTASKSEREKLLADRWRDDGIAFYAIDPGEKGSGKPVYQSVLSSDDGNSTLYFTEGAELTQRKTEGRAMTHAFSVFPTEEAGSVPLMRVYYMGACSRSHDELAAGKRRFEKAFKQWPGQPIGELHWSGLTEETTLVVEAIDTLCPFQGAVSASSLPKLTDRAVPYPAFETLEELQGKSSSGEVTINGQGDGTKPKAIARACLTLAPTTPPEMDWRYDGKKETNSATESFSPDQTRFEFHTPTFDVQLMGQELGQFTFGSVLGELLAVHADNGADVGNLMRFSPKATPMLAADTYVHATMAVDVVSSHRRYPQLLVSDQAWPITQNLPSGSTVIVQTFGPPSDLQIEFCDHRDWGVSDQCPTWDTNTLHDGGKDFLAPHIDMTALQGVDRVVRFDVYVSTQRVYVYVNNEQHACVDLPPGRLSEGKGSVTFGDVLYHSGADLTFGGRDWYTYHDKYMPFFQARHYSNLAFSSSVPRPSWDHERMPCVPSSGLVPHG